MVGGEIIDYKKDIAFELIDGVDKTLPIRIIKQYRNQSSSGFILHWHEQIEIYYIVEGGLVLLCNGKKDWLGQGDIGFVNWCEPHRGVQFLENTVFYTIQIDLSLLDTAILNRHNDFLFTQYEGIPTYIRDKSSLTKICNSLIEEYNNKDEGYLYMARSSIFALIGNLMRLKQTDDTDKSTYTSMSSKNVRAILKYISANYANKVTLEFLSRHFGFSKSHMCHIFKEHTQMTIHQYIKELRCYHAASLMINNTPLSEIYQAVGFNDYNYFSRVFKEIYGISPREFIKQSDYDRKFIKGDYIYL